MHPHTKFFPHIAIPSVITDSLATGFLDDCSFRHDEAPSFTIKDGGNGFVCLFVNPEVVDERPFDCKTRFLVKGEDDLVFYAGDDAAKALKGLASSTEIRNQATAIGENGAEAALSSIQTQLGVPIGNQDYEFGYYEDDERWNALVANLSAYALALRVKILRNEMEAGSSVP